MASDARPESALHDEVHFPSEKFAKIPFEFREPQQTDGCIKLHQNVYVAARVLLVASLRPKEAQATNAILAAQAGLVTSDLLSDLLTRNHMWTSVPNVRVIPVAVNRRRKRKGAFGILNSEFAVRNSEWKGEFGVRSSEWKSNE